MMHSDSFSSSSGIPPYLRAHARRSYSPIGGKQEDARGNGSPAYLLRRLVGAIGVCVAFGAAVSSSAGWIARGSTDQPPHAGGSSYRGVFDGFEVSVGRMLYISSVYKFISEERHETCKANARPPSYGGPQYSLHM